jgi:ParB family chromosome partitioning protein
MTQVQQVHKVTYKPLANWPYRHEKSREKMSAKQRGLGRGLAALMPTAPGPQTSAETGSQPSTEAGSAGSGTAVPGASRGAKLTQNTSSPLVEFVVPEGAYFAELPLDSITPNPRQPRTVFDPEALDELIHSIKEIGLLQPIVVRPLSNNRFELVMGERRWRAHTVAGLATIPAIVRETADADLLRDALLENLHRSQLNALEEAAAYSQLLNDFGCTHDELAPRIGRSRPQISNTIRLLKLPPAVQSKVAAGVLSAGHARALLGLEDPKAQEALATKIVAEGLSVRTVEELVSLGFVGPASKKSGHKKAGPDWSELVDRLEDRLDTKAAISASAKGRGKITVEFASFEDLRRIVDTIAGPQK